MGPLTTFASTLNSLSGSTVSPSLASVVVLGVVVVLWGIYTLITIYHWMRYSHAALIAIPAIAAHLILSAILITFAWGGLVAL